MRNKILLWVIAIIVLAGVYAVYSFSRVAEPETMVDNPDTEMMADKSVADQNGTMAPRDMGGTMIQFSGTVLAGDQAPLLDFNKADFDKALASDNLVVLYFYANWCPICRAEFPRMQEAFNDLTTDKVVAFRVNYNDNETDENEIALAREHGVAYQHTKVFVKNRERILKSPESWEKARYLEEINKAL